MFILRLNIKHAESYKFMIRQIDLLNNKPMNIFYISTLVKRKVKNCVSLAFLITTILSFVNTYILSKTILCFLTLTIATRYL